MTVNVNSMARYKIHAYLRSKYIQARVFYVKLKNKTEILTSFTYIKRCLPYELPINKKKKKTSANLILSFLNVFIIFPQVINCQN